MNVSDLYDGQEHTSLTYQRDEDTIAISMRGMTNHELRDIIVGLWLRLEDDDKRDHIKALQHYLEPGSTAPFVSRHIGTAPDQPQMRRRPS